MIPRQDWSTNRLSQLREHDPQTHWPRMNPNPERSGERGGVKIDAYGDRTKANAKTFSFLATWHLPLLCESERLEGRQNSNEAKRILEWPWINGHLVQQMASANDDSCYLWNQFHIWMVRLFFPGPRVPITIIMREIRRMNIYQTCLSVATSLPLHKQAGRKTRDKLGRYHTTRVTITCHYHENSSFLREARMTTMSRKNVQLIWFQFKRKLKRFVRRSPGSRWFVQVRTCH